MSTRTSTPDDIPLTREQWTKRQTTWRDGETVGYDDSLARFANPAEIDEITAELQANRREWGQEMKAARIAAGPLCKQKGERDEEYGHRWRAMPDDVRWGIAFEPERWQGRRRQINKALKRIRAGKAPDCPINFGRQPKLDALLDRQRDGHTADLEAGATRRPKAGAT
jgi:hypothetical protein